MKRYWAEVRELLIVIGGIAILLAFPIATALLGHPLLAVPVFVVSIAVGFPLLARLAEGEK